MNGCQHRRRVYSSTTPVDRPDHRLWICPECYLQGADPECGQVANDTHYSMLWQQAQGRNPDWWAAPDACQPRPAAEQR